LGARKDDVGFLRNGIEDMSRASQLLANAQLHSMTEDEARTLGVSRPVWVENLALEASIIAD